MENDDLDFHEWRRLGIGSSDAKTVMHGDEKKWAALVKVKNGEPEKGRTQAMDRLAQLGRLVEGAAMDWVREDRPELRPIMQQVRMKKGMGQYSLSGDELIATLDGLAADGRPVETKFSFEPGKTIEEIADKHNPQLQHQINVTGARSAILAIVSASWGKFDIVEVERDDEYTGVYLQRCAAFFDYWRRGASYPGNVPVQRTATIVRLRDHVWAPDDNQIADVAVPWIEAKIATDQLELRRHALIAMFPDDAKTAKWVRGSTGIKMTRNKAGVVSVSLI